MTFAAFIITYERPRQAVKMVQELFSQTFPPQKILIVDNSVSVSTRSAIAELQDDRIEYFEVGHNSGPAGGAYFGLTKLAEQGYEWILWIDDDDYPSHLDLVERIFKLTEPEREAGRVGMIGAVGTGFDFLKGESRRVSDAELLEDKLLNVYFIAGGMLPIINRQVVLKGILPDEKLFFGFEELDFGLRVRSAGFKIVVPSQIMREKRMRAGRWGLERSAMKNLDGINPKDLWRQYYSVRNVTYIFSHKYLNLGILLRYSVKYTIKSMLSFKRGWRFGLRCSYFIVLGYTHGLFAKMGRVVEPSNK